MCLTLCLGSSSCGNDASDGDGAGSSGTSGEGDGDGGGDGDGDGDGGDGDGGDGDGDGDGDGGEGDGDGGDGDGGEGDGGDGDGGDDDDDDGDDDDDDDDGDDDDGDDDDGDDDDGDDDDDDEPDDGTSMSWTPIGPDGWSIYEPHADTQRIYVSESGGDDANDGLSEAKPVQTVARALALAKARSSNGTVARPDWILFKAGDTWQEGFQFRSDTIRGGLDVEYPFILTSYGEGDRPRFVWTDSGPLWAYGWWGGGYPTGSEAAAYWSILGLDFYTPNKDPGSGSFEEGRVYEPGNPPVVAFQGEGHHIIFEDCSFRYTAVAVQAQSGHHVAFRRNLLLDNYGYHDHPSTNNVYHHGQGIYMNLVDEVLFEGNLFDHNGWLDETTHPTTAPTIYNHNAYLDAETTHVTIHGNITARASADGFKTRGGGNMVDNLCLSNGISININENGSPGVDQTALYNVVLGSLDLPLHGPAANSGHLARDWGINFGSITESALSAKGNIVAHSESGTRPLSSNCEGISACAEGHVVYQWGSYPDSSGVFPNPERSVETYMETLGETPTLEAFLAEARQQSRANWRRKYTAKAVNDYIREGFGVVVE